MPDRLVPVFWCSLVASVPAAFFASPGMLRWGAIGWLGLVGLLFSLANWGILLALVLRKKSGSFVPALGGLLLCLAVGAIPVTRLRLWAPVGFLVDPFGPAMVVAFLWSLGRSRPKTDDLG